MQTHSSPLTVIVTGASSGIGRAASLALLAAGHQVVLAGRRLEALQAVVNEAQAPQRSLAHVTDVTDEHSVAALFQAAIQTFGRVDVLFNNAGIAALSTPTEELSLTHWNAVLNTNLTGMFLCLREAFRVMPMQSPPGGRIINNGSVSAQVPRPNAIAYTATKHAITGLTRSAALDGRAQGIAVGQIDIGNAATPMVSQIQAGILQANGDTVMEPTMDVEIVAQSVLYMASLPLEANVLFHTVMATNMPLVGRG